MAGKMKPLGLAFAVGLLQVALQAGPAFAQIDEIIVTAQKRDVEAFPGVFLEKRGNFLLLEVTIENDSRDLETRLKEIDETVGRLLDAAEKDKTITLNLIDETDLVRPLSMDTFHAGIMAGGRPDTSLAYLQVKTQIPDKVADSYKLSQKLADFVAGVEEIGRTELITENEITVSILNPYQYRGEVLALIAKEIKSVTDGLGPDYRVIVTGIDKGLQWTRSGDLNLAFYIPYSYTIIPTSVQSFTTQYLED